MELEYSLDESDLIALANYQVGNSPVVRKRFKARRAAYLIGFSFLAVGAYFISMPLIIPISLAASGVLWFILYPLYAKWYTQKNIPRIVRSQMRPSSLGKHKLKATIEGLEQISEAGESKVKWIVVDNIIENSGHTFISIEKNFAIIVPRFKIEKSYYEEFMNIFRLYQSNPPALINNPHA
jgi:hypothetical protein